MHPIVAPNIEDIEDPEFDISEEMEDEAEFSEFDGPCILDEPAEDAETTEKVEAE